MTAVRKIGAIIAAVLLTAGGIGLSAAAPAQAKPGVATRTAVFPYAGHYMGSDQAGRHIRFSYDGHRVNHFSINGHSLLSGAPVQGHQVHHYCNSHGSMCIRGTWVSDVQFVGHWNDPRQGHSVTFSVNLYAH